MSAPAQLALRVPEDDGDGLANQVYRELREAICDFRLPPNQRLVQNGLADQLGISRTPVRDALLRLAQEGLVRPAPWRGGYLVSEFTPQGVLEIYEVRIALEPLAAEQAAGLHTRAEIAQLRDLNARIETEPVGPVSEHYELNKPFHAVVVRPCGNDILKRMLDQLWSMPSALRMYHHQVAGGEVISEMVAEHDAILEALEQGAGAVARRRVQSHLEGAKRQALEHFNGQGA